MVRLAEKSQLVSLKNLADQMMDRVDALEEPDEGWDAALPSWTGKDQDRGLKQWGSRTFTKKRNKHKTWKTGGLCQLVIQNAISFYCKTIGLPPVVTGEHISPNHIPNTYHT